MRQGPEPEDFINHRIHRNLDIFVGKDHDRHVEFLFGSAEGTIHNADYSRFPFKASKPGFLLLYPADVTPNVTQLALLGIRNTLWQDTRSGKKLAVFVGNEGPFAGQRVLNLNGQFSVTRVSSVAVIISV